MLAILLQHVRLDVLSGAEREQIDDFQRQLADVERLKSRRQRAAD